MSGRRISDETKLKRGFGSGTGMDYIPWFTVGEVSSMGRKRMPRGLITNRPHVFLSSFEGDYFYYLDKSNSISDIREQYPLDWSITKSICDELGIRHIRGKDRKLTHYTTDFLITKKDGVIVARTCKLRKDLNSDKAESIKEKFTIEDEYYKRLGIDWKVVREVDFDSEKARNFGSCYKMRTLGLYDQRFLDFETYKAHIYMLLDMLLTHSDLSLSNVINRYETAGDLRGNGINVLRHMILNKIIVIDMKKFLINNEPLKIIRYEKDLEFHLKSAWDWNSQLKSETQFIYMQDAEI